MHQGQTRTLKISEGLQKTCDLLQILVSLKNPLFELQIIHTCQFTGHVLLLIATLCFIIMDLRGGGNRLVQNMGSERIWPRFPDTFRRMFPHETLEYSVSLNARSSSKKCSHLRLCADWWLVTAVFHPKRLVNKRCRTGAIWKCALDV